MFDRRSFLKAAGLFAVSPASTLSGLSEDRGLLVNDIHSQLNPTRVDRIVSCDSLERARRTLRRARGEGKVVAIAGGRHAMGAQQFATDSVLLDMRGMKRVGRLDDERGIVDVEAGIQWPELIENLVRVQEGRQRQWGIAQKQTGADRLTLGGAVAANVHGRGLAMRPFISDVESLVLLDGAGETHTCSRSENTELSEGDWATLLSLAHFDKSRAFESYLRHYLATSGQIYWSDTHQLSTYLDDYHRRLDRGRGTGRATEMITEIYVPRDTLTGFLREVREDFRASGVNVIYGTIRLIERDEESFLSWARRSYACIIFNLHTVHTPEGISQAADAFRRLIDMAIRRKGNYYLTYHKYATRAQVESCYPQFRDFLRLKKKYDPEERFQSDWYRHYRKMFAA